MALMPHGNLRIKDRSANARLIVSNVSGGPAEEFVLDPDLPVLFEHPFGFPGLTQVVIPKGLAVAVLPEPVDDPVTGYPKPALTICNPEVGKYVGIAPYNLCKRPQDSLTGNLATFVRDVYIELPYIPNPADCALVKYGALHDRELDESNTISPVIGDYVTWSRDPNNQGHLTVWTTADEDREIIGQIVALETEAEPWGWLKWVMWDEAARREDGIEPDWAQGRRPGEYRAEYREGTLYQAGYHSPYTSKPTGIKGLTDGAYRGAVYADFLVPEGAAEVTIDVKTAVGQEFALVKNGLVKAFVGGIELPASLVKPDYENNAVTVRLPYPAPQGGVSGKLIIQNTDEFIGTPPGWDYVGSAGVARIMIF